MRYNLQTQEQVQSFCCILMEARTANLDLCINSHLPETLQFRLIQKNVQNLVENEKRHHYRLNINWHNFYVF